MLPFGFANFSASLFGLVGPETITIYNKYISEYRPDKLLSFGWMQHTYDRLKQKVLSIADLPAKDLESFCAIASPLKYNKGEILLKEGETCRNIYFVQQGYLRSYHTRDGLEINTGFHFEDSFATNLKSLRTQSPSESFLVAAEPVLVFQFTSEIMKDLYTRCPPIVDFGKKLLENLAIEREEDLNLFRLYSAEERFRHFEEKRPQILQRVPLSYLASYLGVARETLSRFRKK